jgi:hypothetical protein
MLISRVTVGQDLMCTLLGIGIWAALGSWKNPLFATEIPYLGPRQDRDRDRVGVQQM